MNPHSFQTVCKATAAVVATLILAAPAAAETFYTATPIRLKGQNLSAIATAINASGVIVGYGTPWDAPEVGFMFDAGVVRDLASFVPTGINDAGTLVGWQLDSPGRAFVVTGGVAKEIKAPGAFDIRATAIDAKGTIVGSYRSGGSGPSTRAFALRDGSFDDLGALDGTSPYGTYASAIGSSGEVVGASGIGARSSHAFRWSRAHLTDLGTLGGSFSAATGINHRGEIVGYSTTARDERSRAFVYSDGSMRDLGTPPGDSYAAAINATGEIVGQRTNDEGRHVAFVLSHGTLRDLDAQVVTGLDGNIYEAVAINDAGQIAANACTRTLDACFAVRLDPVREADRVAIEYHHAAFDHYFLTADVGEIAKLDSGAFEGWARTGQGFVVAPEPRSGTSSVCRFFSTSFGAKSSHFYTASPDECAYVKARLAHDWTFEGEVFSVAAPDMAGACPEGTVPVYRIYNNGQGGAPNHRYTTSPSVRTQMIAAGWIPEGSGALGVSMCALS